MAQNQADPFADYIGGDYDEFDENQMLERALDLGLDFETARDMIFSGNSALLNSMALAKNGADKGAQSAAFARPPYQDKYAHRNVEDDIAALIEEMHLDDQLNASAPPFVMPNQSMPASGAYNAGWQPDPYQNASAYPAYYPPYNPYDQSGFQPAAPGFPYFAPPMQPQHPSPMSYYGYNAPAEAQSTDVVAPSSGMPSLLQPLTQSAPSDLNPGAEDCRYFMTSSCRADRNCSFRHCHAAKSSNQVCESFSQTGRCAKPSECTARHSHSASAAPTPVHTSTTAHTSIIKPKSSFAILPTCWVHKNGKCKRGMACAAFHSTAPTPEALEQAKQRVVAPPSAASQKKKQLVDWARWKTLLDAGLVWDGQEKDWPLISALNHEEIELYQHAKSLAEIFNLGDFQKYEGFAKSRGQMWASLRDQLRNLGATAPNFNPGDQ